MFRNGELVVSYRHSGKRIGPFFKGQVVLDPATDSFQRNVGNYLPVCSA